MSIVFYLLIQIAVFVLIAPLPSGIIRKIKALFSKRQGAPILQPYYDIIKLLKKPSVTISTTTSFVHTITPYVLLGSMLAAATLVPITTKLPIVTSVTDILHGDAIMLIYTLALGGFFLTLTALDSSSTFGGMGSSRENTLTSIIEPSFIVTIVAIALLYGSTDLLHIMTQSTLTPPLSDPLHVILLVTLLMITIAETARIPIDDPSTHLELTMIHEAMILEYSGRHLGLIEMAAHVKQLIFITLIANVFFPHDQLITVGGLLGVVLSILIYIVKVVFIGAILGLIETNTVKLRIFSIANYAALAMILSLLGFLCLYILI